jgi:hypothetical protein
MLKKNTKLIAPKLNRKQAAIVPIGKASRNFIMKLLKEAL